MNILFVGVLGWGGEVAAYEVACQLPKKGPFKGSQLTCQNIQP